ncbi:MAG: LysM peptidoglycan-binding domain-containing protein [Wenzhouxiangella sp.]|nr:LysM peptidoglycan-binding domain-containing protein [Wenzhouxiangella sp.]MCH8477025.1 LysM peptidoglycan-binding domain-containing protein [Wenzhouxiangella sp.]TVR95608.1 MAG: LysM domain-containing protein [Wenzhouxiangellaceae bacterium]
MNPVRNILRKAGGALLLLLLMAYLVACQTIPVEAEPEPEPEPEPPTTAVEPEPQPEAPPATLQNAVDLLDLGEVDEAEAVLVRILERTPGSRIARRLLGQIQSDPIELMGADYDVVEVQAGESLSVIAHRELGDSLQFFALARYNGITVPRRLAPGMVVRIPRQLRPKPAVDTEAESVTVSVESGNEAAAQLAEELPGDDEALARKRRAGVLYAEGLSERQAGNYYLAISRFDQAVELDPDLAEASQAAAATRAELVERLHEQALGLYRDQRIDESIALWEEAVALNPEFEPAQVNLERARAVQRRLRELD